MMVAYLSGDVATAIIRIIRFQQTIDRQNEHINGTLADPLVKEMCVEQFEQCVYSVLCSIDRSCIEIQTP